MNIDRDAPAQATGSILVSAPPDMVWDVLADLESWPGWMPGVTSMSPDGPVEEGTTFRWKAGPFRLVSTLESVRRPDEIGWTGRMLGIAARHVWRFESEGDATAVHTEESWQAWWLRPLSSLMKSRLQDAIDDGLAALKAEAEQRVDGTWRS